MLEIRKKKQFVKSLKKYRNKKKILQEIDIVLDLLVFRKEIPKKYKDHELRGKLAGIRELHLGYDDLLLYFIIDEANELVLVDIGTHSHTLKI